MQNQSTEKMDKGMPCHGNPTHGRRTCMARKPLCNVCVVEKSCNPPDKTFHSKQLLNRFTISISFVTGFTRTQYLVLYIR